MSLARDALVRATRKLAEAGVPDPGRDARRLLAHAMKVPPDRLTLMLGEGLAAEAEAGFEALVARRAERVPLSQLTGRRAFYGREFLVTGDVLDPRPETETLIETALAEPFADVLDLGTGSGCILLTLIAEMEGMGRRVLGTGVEVSPAAYEVAWWNRNAMGLEDRAVLLQGSWFAPLSEAFGRDAPQFDLIVSNPPYVTEAEWERLEPEVRRFEPRGALVGGVHGLDAYRVIVEGAPGRLRPGGRLIVEIGSGQGAAVTELMTSAGLGPVHVVTDLDGRDRVVVARR
ncbi:peptide chain release factor N(5)-glutamine methyltransferase [Histidinibacterium lentulum]|uniref:Release factor glutamine methyltransferase n=1 Tax=Histidinibacterium lentulum TaxID=2480588 RepID=A0A3N2QTG7_9RHOB|nr:peptide chain release factor N(5)-glutamine methyltransferase [Histidinibacterium lentulum]ROT98460.1 peptide chain release factor N(5)-glutamine methyltransferase [Histidinibacterium lentulum]